MRLPRVRFTVRGMIFAIAVVAGLLGAWFEGSKWKRWSVFYEGKGWGHFWEEAKAQRDLVETERMRLPDPSDEDQLRSRAAFLSYCRDKVDYHARMRQRYERAASHPWEDV